MVNCNFKLWTIASVLSMFTLSCSKMAVSVGDEDTQGSVRFSVNADYAFQSPTKADVSDANLSPEMFTVELINSKGVTFKRFKQCDSTFLLNAGQFTARAYYGDPTGVGFDSWYFEGKTDFTVLPQQENVGVTITCKPANSKIGVEFGPVIKEQYKDVQAYVYNIEYSTDSLIFDTLTNEAGYLPSGKVMFGLVLIDKSGEDWFYKLSVPEEVNPADFLVFEVDTEKMPDYLQGINIVIEDGVNRAPLKTITIPYSSWLPKDAPTHVASGLEEFSSISDTQIDIIEGVGIDDSKANVAFTVPGKIEECIMTIKSKYLVDELGIPEEINLANVTDSKALEFLNAIGFKSNSNLKDKEEAFFLMSKLSQYIQYVENESNLHSFSISVRDQKNKPDKGVKWTFAVTPAQILANNVNDVDTWSHSTVVKLVSQLGNVNLMYPEISSDNGKSWSKPVYTSTVEGNVKTCSITNLASGTTYKIRARYNKHAVEAKNSFTTEYATNVANAGFEDFWMEKIEYKAWTSSYSRYVYYPWAQNSSSDNRHWATNNSETCFNPSTPAYQNGKQFPSVNYTESSHSGSKAAELRNVTIGSGSNALGIGATGIVHTCGKLWLATGGSSDASAEGNAHSDRPTAMKFYAKYDSYNSDQGSVEVSLFSDQTCIATGSLKFTNTISSWTEQTVNLNYTRTDLKATKIKIKFQSSTLSEPPYKKNTNTYINGTKFEDSHTGSVLDIDDITLVYDK